MTEETGAAAPTTEQASNAPAASEQATPKIESIPNPNAEASPPENAEPKADETEQSNPEGEEKAEPKKLSHSQRTRRNYIRALNENMELKAKVEALEKGQSIGGSQSDPMPKEADYNGDYFAYQADLTAWKAASSLESRLAKRDIAASEKNLVEQRQELETDFRLRLNEIKSIVPDIEAKISAFVKSGGDLAPHVYEQVVLNTTDGKGPMLLYQIASSPELASQLNAMSPIDAAREIGRLEAKVVLPQPRMQTKAPALLAEIPKGGAAPAKDLAALAKSDDASAYIAARRAQQKARA